MNNKQSSVDWFISQLEEKGDAWETPSIRNIQFNLDVSEYLALKKQAKAMHKEEIIETIEFAECGGESGIDAQQYYTYTFGGNND